MHKVTGAAAFKASWTIVPMGRYEVLGYLTIALGVALAYLRRFVQDDAFISFAYARNLAEGRGLTWFGEHVEGFTNFLWTLLIAAGIAIGFDPIDWSYVLGLLSFLGSLLLCKAMLRKYVDSPVWAAAGLLVLATNYSFFAYATGGLETMLQTLLLLVCVALTLRILDAPRPSAVTNVLLGVVFALSILNRFDAAIFLAVLSAFLAVHFYRTGGFAGLVAWSLQMLVPFCCLVVPLLVWKLSYYGSVLPNTYYVKSGMSVGTWARGAIYVLGFLSAYLFLPVLIVLFLKRRLVLAQPDRSMRFLMLLSSLCVLWWFYVIKTGGDFMEYRFLVPTLPLLVLGITTALVRAGDHLKMIVFVLLMLGNVFEPFATEILGTRWGVLRKGFASIGALDISREGWDTTGKQLGELFEYSPEIVIAVKPAGAIPFYSRLPSVDMLGLNDKWVATHGEYDPNAPPGHQRKATLAYLLARDVNIVVGHPRIRGRTDPRPRYDLDYVESQFISVPEHLRSMVCETVMLEVPIGADELLAVWVVTPGIEAMNRTIAERQLESFPLDDCRPN